jgi:phosphate transport system substrate-binding protein
MPKNGMLVRISLVLAAAAALATVAVSAAGAARQSATLQGAGSTFVAPLVATWTQVPSQAGSPFTSAKGITVNYTASGSGPGVLAIRNNQVDFGASDAPLSAYASNATCETCYQIPWALSGTAVIYHIDGVTKQLNMSGEVLAKIYLGQITNWNDAAIKKLNKGVTIPSTPIITVHRDSASGTTYNFTDFLSRVSSAFKSQTGTGVAPNWQGSNQLAAHGSNGVDTAVKNNNGAVGYVDVYYGVNNHLAFMKIKNRAGHFVTPTTSSIGQAAHVDTHPAADGSLSIVNPPNKMGYSNAYPISTYTYVDVQKHSQQTAALKTLLNWAVTAGQSYAKQDVFVPLPKTVVTYDQGQIKKIG